MVHVDLGELSRRLAEHVVQTESLPKRELLTAQASLIDAVAVSIAASTLTPAARPFLEVAMETSHGASAIIGFGERCSAPMAAWVNGALAHGIDYEDTHDSAIAHPHAAAIAAALAIVDYRADAISGTELLTAIGLAGDLVCRIAASFDVSPDSFGWHVTPWLGVFGAATAAGKLLKLDADQMIAAWSLSMSQMASFGELKYSPLSDVRSVRDAFAAKAGVLGAMLAARNVRGYDEPLEGKAGFLNGVARNQYQPARILEDLGEKFLGAEVSFKPWPACRGTHAYIEAGIAISQMPGFDACKVAGIEVVINQKNEMLCVPEELKRAPENAIGAKFSIPFTLATALVKGEVAIASFEPDALQDPKILSVAAKVRHRLDPNIPLRATTKGSVTVRAGNDEFSHSVEKALGHPEKPLGPAEHKAKFDDCLSYAVRPFSEETRTQLWECLNQLHTLNDARKMTALLA